MDCVQPIPPTNSLKKNSSSNFSSSVPAIKKDDNHHSKGVPLSVSSLRSALYKEYEREVPFVLKLQSYRNKYLDKYFGFASYLGEEEFYILSMPMTFWFLSRMLAAELCIMLAMSIATGNILKNTFLLPRPPYPAVWTNTSPQMDHGMPSTHTSSSLSLQFYYFLFFYHILPVQNPFIPYPVALILVVTSIVSVMVSRVYNGHHTPMDVAGGFIIGSLTIAIFTFYRHVYVGLLLNGSWAVPMCGFLLCCIVLLLHPQPKVPSPAYPESGLVTGTAFGAFFATWINSNTRVPQFFQEYAGSQYGFLKDHLYILALVRLVFCVVVVLIAKTLSKKLYYIVYSSVASTPKKKAIVTPTVEAFGKLFTYTCVGATVILMPALLLSCNIQTPFEWETYRTELAAYNQLASATTI
ncbi:hypothetical protein SAMD00019534_116320 [Acytostelium subglobosum LB1]|uniref:hypothetical protein n=1 Tax=Acytostelium subglobosum LB1 TaxID=1410327 RepID=UPI000644F3DD|nr:hypothetical protein SAMD00019534_116320 [Acytostelium subglobosum LB1]GAM28456.1 hypothetical protein SAMD00019534_116320 [Acytostelium subglobosum LB1]|eukprot:XP_012748495.1 hypothetical protein SAMD00019534_116320 [Acytostelium subglobosum LB1]